MLGVVRSVAAVQGLLQHCGLLPAQEPRRGQVRPAPPRRRGLRACLPASVPACLPASVPACLPSCLQLAHPPARPPSLACPRRLFYLLLFCAAAVLGITLRYTGQAALQGWASVVATACAAAGSAAGSDSAGSVTACFGLQAAYRVSASLCGFFTVMLLLVAVAPVAHHGAWLLKLCFYLVLLGVSVVIPNGFFVGYAQASRFGSVVFLVIQCIIIVDFAYVLHEGLLARIEAREAEMERAGIEPGLLSNGWKVLYLAAAVILAGGSVACLGVMYPVFGTPACQLGQFFLSETLVVGAVLLIVSVLDCGGRGTPVGLLPPAVLWAYNTYLAYGALTNNPDTTCNVFVAAGSSAPASIYIGLAIVIISVSWAAYSSAGGLVRAVSGAAAHERALAGGAGVAASRSETTPVAVANRLPATPSTGAGAPKSAAAYADADDEAADGGAQQWGSGRSAAGKQPVPAAGAAAAASDADEPDALAWVFHLVMAFAGLYLAMLCTK